MSTASSEERPDGVAGAGPDSGTGPEVTHGVPTSGTAEAATDGGSGQGANAADGEPASGESRDGESVASGGSSDGGGADAGGSPADGGTDPGADGSSAEPEPEPESGAGDTRDERRLSTASTTLLGLFLLAEVVFVCGALVTLWPAVLETVEPGADPTATARWSPFGFGNWSLTADTAMLLAVVVCSALGSFVHAATSFATYVGNRRLYASWLWWYLLRAGIGIALALLVHLLLRGGLFAGSSGAGATNPYGFSGIAGLCGLFSKQATDKLREICDTLLSTTGDGDRDRRDGLAAARNGGPGPS
ncbi:hypothetical protein [Streptomyces sp. NBC_00391]|uniref:hypothetical protein n=1 Tax=Streptomyces sp. NBC_00391 TaxID=2903647 RepID=UPI002E1ED3E6